MHQNDGKPRSIDTREWQEFIYLLQGKVIEMIDDQAYIE
jgi:hypothetical protein